MRLSESVLALSLVSLVGAVYADDPLEMGKAVFTQQAVPSCTICHTLSDAGSSGQIGPNLDTMAPSTDQVYSAISQGVGIMPSYSGSLSEEQRRAVAFYISEVTKP